MFFWKADEDDFMFARIKVHGMSWVKVCKDMDEWKPDREYTVSMIRNRYARLKRMQHIKKRNRCHKCGEFKRAHICRASNSTLFDSILPSDPDICLDDNDPFIQLVNRFMNTLHD
jgi:hypothetical protein